MCLNGGERMVDKKLLLSIPDCMKSTPAGAQVGSFTGPYHASQGAGKSIFNFDILRKKLATAHFNKLPKEEQIAVLLRYGSAFKWWVSEKPFITEEVPTITYTG